MPQIEIYKVDDNYWSFRVDGKESLESIHSHNFPQQVQLGPGVYMDKDSLRLPSTRYPEGTYGVWRMLRRIRQGQVREVQRYHRGRVVKLPKASDEAPRQWTFEFDGQQSTEVYDTEAEAIAALGFHGFMHRGALGRLQEIIDNFKVQAGSSDATCKVDGGRFVVTCGDTGKQYLARPDILRADPPDERPFKPPMTVTFKELSPPPTEEE